MLTFQSVAWILFGLTAVYLHTAEKSIFTVDLSECTENYEELRNFSCHQTKNNLSVFHEDTCTPERFGCHECSKASCWFSGREHSLVPHTFEASTIVLIWVFFMAASSFNQMVIAKAFLHWYWLPGKKKLTPIAAFKSSMWSIFRYHIGTAVKGAILIPVVSIPVTLQSSIDRARKKRPKNRKLAFVYCLFYPLHVICKW